MSRSLRSLGALLVATGALATGATAAQSKTLDVVLLGDSYASGVGAGNYSQDCGRSPGAWGEVFGQLARAKGLTVNVTNAACGGSTTAELDSQIPAVTTDTDLVLMMTGGNDTDVSDAAPWCFLPLIAGPNSCKSHLEVSISKAPAVEPSLLDRLRVLRSRMRPDAKIVFAGYPNFALGSYTLKTWFASYDSGLAINRLSDSLDAAAQGAISTVNAEAGRQFVTYVSTKAWFAGHEIDADPWRENPVSWIHELSDISTLSEPFHPTAEGHRQIAAAVMASAGPAGDFGVAQ